MADGYRDLGIYDAPGLALSQIAGGQFSLENLLDDVRDPKRLAPEARKTLAERTLGTNDGVLGTAASIATNPFVIAMLFSHAPVGAALKAGLSPFEVKNSAFFKNKSVMAAMGLLGLTERTLGHHAEPVLSKANELLKDAVEPALARMNQPLAKVMEEMGVSSWDKKAVAAVDPMKARRMAEVETAMALHAYGIEDGVLEVRAPRVRTRMGIGQPIQTGEKKGGLKTFDWHASELGTSTDGTDALVRYEKAQKEYAAWEAERNRLQAVMNEFKERGERAPKEVWVQFRDHMNTPAPKPYAVPETYVPEKPDYVHDLEGAGARGATRAMFDRIMANATPAEVEAIRAARTEMEATKQALFQPDATGMIPERQAKVFLQSIRSRAGENGEIIGGVLDAAFGAGGAYQGQTGAQLFFSKEHQAAFGMVFPAGATAPSRSQGMGELRKYLSMGDGLKRGYIPLNTFDEVLVPGVHDNPAFRTLKRSELEAVQEKGLSAAPSLVTPITGKGVRLHPEDLRMIASVADDPAMKAHLETQAMSVEADARDIATRHGMSIPAARLDPLRVQRRYVREARAYSVLTQAPTEDMLEAQSVAFAAAKKKGWTAPYVDPITQDPTTGDKGRRLDEPWATSIKVTKGWDASHPDLKGRESAASFMTGAEGSSLVGGDHLTIEGMLRNTNLTLAEEGTRNQHRLVLNGLLGRTDPTGRVLLAAHHQAQQGLRDFLGTRLGSWLEGAVPSLGQKLRALSTQGETADTGKGMWAGIARYFYTTHLGLNLGSITTNLMQPFTMVAPQVGAVATLKAYKRALGDMAAYSKARIERFGPRLITASERHQLIRDVMPHAERWGIGESYLSTLDTMVYGSRLAPKKGLWDKVEEVMLKGFEKSEILNRLVSGHAYEIAHEASGLPKTALFRDEQARFVTLTQFGNTPTNTPEFMMSGKLFSNPVLKQFLSFPVRSFTGFFHTAPQLGGENYWRGLLNHGVRAMGMSAVIYEAGKGILGADLSKGLAASGATDIFGGERFTEDGNGWIKVPPIVSVPQSVVAGLATGDGAKLADAVSRLVPGGVALSRAMGVLPETGMPPFSMLQKTYAGWDTPLPDGRVPVFKAGRLVDYKNPSELVMRGLGVDLGKFGEPGSLDGYLVKQRELIVQYRQEYLARLAANDHGGAESVAKQFQQKFDVPLTVTKEQVRNFVQSRNTPRTERIMDRLPAEIRAKYAPIVAGARGLNVPADSLTGGGSSGSRNPVRQMPLGQGDLEGAIRKAMQGRVESDQTDRMEFGPMGS